MMYVDPIDTYGKGNIVSYADCVAYYYQIKPINSLYASDMQLETLIEALRDKILSVNMPGAIYILPKRVNEQRIINYYEALYQANGRSQLDVLKQCMMQDIKKQLAEKIRYKYSIYIVFTDNRDPLKRRLFADLLHKDHLPLTEGMQELCAIADEQIYKKLSQNLSTERLTKQELAQLHNYLAIPTEGKIVDYYTTPQPTTLHYEYKALGSSEYRDLYSCVLTAEQIRYDIVSDGGKANTAVNRIQEYDYPVDTIVKFDLEHTQTFRRNMTSKRESIRKSAKRYYNLAERKDKEANKAVELAKIGENSDPSIEDSKIRWQMMFRLRANNEKMLTKRSDRMIKRFEGKKITLINAIGEQEKLAKHLFPYKNTYGHCLQLSDVLFFATFNFLGGLYIGEEEEGMIATFTNTADLPVLIDVEAPIKGKTRNASSTMCFVGETGSGKSQLANHLLLTSMIFYGHKTLLIDPKGDRNRLVDTLNSYGDICSHLIIGGEDCVAGLFDAFLLHQDNEEEALSIAKNDVMNLVRAINANEQLNLMDVDRAYEDMCIAQQEGKIQQLCMGNLCKFLMKHDSIAASNLLSLVKDPMAKLFFGSDETDLSKVFDLSKPFNLVTFARLPVFSSKAGKYEYHETDMTHRISALVVNKTTEITNLFIRLEKGKAKTLLVDEAKLWMTIPGGRDVLINNNLIARSELMNLLIILQNWSDLPNSIIANAGQFFIGSMKSKAEIKAILDHFDLGDHSALVSSLSDRTKAEGVKKEKQFNFLYCDYNNRKCMTKLKFLNIFANAFNTFKQGDIHGKEAVITGDEPYEL